MTIKVEHVYWLLLKKVVPNFLLQIMTILTVTQNPQYL